MKIGELFIFLGFQVDDKKLKDFDKGIAGLGKQLDLTKIGAVAAVYAIDRFIESSVSGAVALHNFNQQTGESVQALQQWQAAANAANPALGIDQIAQSIQTLENNLVEIRKFGSGNASPFAWLKIDISHGQTAIDVLEQLRDRVNQLDRPTAINLIQKMGLDPGFINILTKSRQEFDNFVKGTQRSNEAIKRLQELGERVANFKLSLSVLKDNFNSQFAPFLIRFIDIIEKIGRAFALFGDMIGFQFPIFVKTFVAGIGVLILALNPLKTLISGIILLLTDLYVYKKGGKSLLGELLGQGEQGGFTKSVYGEEPHKNPFYEFLYHLGQDYYKMGQGEFKKDAFPSTSDNSSINRNVTINNDIKISHPDGESIAERIVRNNKKSLDQIDLDWAYTDQYYKGSGY